MVGKPDSRQRPRSAGNWLAVARAIQGEADKIGLAQSSAEKASILDDDNRVLQRFDEVVDREAIRSVSRKLFEDGHYARSVEEAFKCLNNAVKEKSGLSDQDGYRLMQGAFSAKSPVLRLNDLLTVSDKDEQLGYMNMFAGAIAGIRNPRAHEHEIDDQPDVALELLTLANHLMRKLEASTKTS